MLDGFPRTQRQAEYLFENWNLDKVIYLDIPDEVVSGRVMHRARVGEGSRFTKRVDDDPEALTTRLREYHEKTQPLLDLYRKKEILITIDANRPIPRIYEEIRLRLSLPAPENHGQSAHTESLESLSKVSQS